MTGFSVMTVSRVLNQPQLVKPETYQKVMAVINESGYVQNRVARSLVTGRAHNICIYVPSSLDADTSFVAQTVSAIGEKLGTLGYSLTFRREMADDVNFDGIIAMGLHIDEEKDFVAISEKKPALLYGNSDHFCNWVDVDNYRGMYKMAQYAVDRGHRRLAYIGLAHNSRYVLQRKNGFLDCMRDNGIEVDSNSVLATENSEGAGFEACEHLLDATKPSVIMCATDLLAVGVVHLLKRRHMAIPQDIAVTGFDGFGIENTVFPKLTTVTQPLYAVGVKLAETIVDMINGKTPDEGIYIEPTLSVGETV